MAGRLCLAKSLHPATPARVAGLPAAEGYGAAIQRCGPQQQHLAQALRELLVGVQEELKLHDSYAAVSPCCHAVLCCPAVPSCRSVVACGRPFEAKTAVRCRAGSVGCRCCGQGSGSWQLCTSMLQGGAGRLRPVAPVPWLSSCPCLSAVLRVRILGWHQTVRRLRAIPSCVMCILPPFPPPPPQEWGVDLSQHQQPLPATKAYVDWLHAVASDPQQARPGTPCSKARHFSQGQLAAHGRTALWAVCCLQLTEGLCVSSPEALQLAHSSLHGPQQTNTVYWAGTSGTLGPASGAAPPLHLRHRLRPARSPSLPPHACLQGVAGIVSAMVPCLRLYAYLALQLGKAFPEAEHEYTGQWQAGAAFSRMSLKAPGQAGAAWARARSLRGTESVCNGAPQHAAPPAPAPPCCLASPARRRVGALLQQPRVPAPARQGGGGTGRDCGLGELW